MPSWNSVNNWGLQSLISVPLSQLPTAPTSSCSLELFRSPLIPTAAAGTAFPSLSPVRDLLPSPCPTLYTSASPPISHSQRGGGVKQPLDISLVSDIYLMIHNSRKITVLK